MKKILIALMAAALLLLTASLALADVPTVSFAKTSDKINGGCDYTLGIKINQTQSADFPVQIVNNVTGVTYDLVIPAGQTTATVVIDTDVVEKRVTHTFSLVESDAYKRGQKLSLELYQLPKVQFYLAVFQGNIGQKMNVIVQCNNPGSVIRGNNTFTLKNQHGDVLGQKEWGNANNRLTFQIDVTEEMYGKQSFTVWLDDNCVTPDDGYGVIAYAKEPPLTELECELPVMAIGIDCGFSDGKCYKILEVLEKHNVKVTFFMTGYFLREYPEEAKAIYEAGHEIASHSNTHKHMTDLSTWNQYRQITIPIEEAEALLGVTPRLYRPPYGEYNKVITSISRAEGMEVVMWGPTYHDSTGKYTQKQIMSLATDGNDYKPGTIVLCHLDGYEQPNSLDAGLTYYKSLGLQVVPISALIYASGNHLPPMPHDRAALVYTDEYWATWMQRELPEFLEAHGVAVE